MHTRSAVLCAAVFRSLLGQRTFCRLLYVACLLGFEGCTGTPKAPPNSPHCCRAGKRRAGRQTKWCPPTNHSNQPTGQPTNHSKHARSAPRTWTALCRPASPASSSTGSSKVQQTDIAAFMPCGAPARRGARPRGRVGSRLDVLACCWRAAQPTQPRQALALLEARVKRPKPGPNFGPPPTQNTRHGPLLPS